MQKARLVFLLLIDQIRSLWTRTKVLKVVYIPVHQRKYIIFSMYIFTVFM